MAASRDRSRRPALAGPRPIVILESRAHEGIGHFPVVFAEVWEALSEVGYSVTALTARGWLLEGEVTHSFELQRIGRLATYARRWTFRLRRLQGRFNRRAAAVLD